MFPPHQISELEAGSRVVVWQLAILYFGLVERLLNGIHPGWKGIVLCVWIREEEGVPSPNSFNSPRTFQF